MSREDNAEKRKNEKLKKIKAKGKKRGIMDISPSYPLYTVRRSRFAKRFFEMAPTPLEEPLHQRSQSRSCFE
jgi:hypothetical protein